MQYSKNFSIIRHLFYSEVVYTLCTKRQQFLSQNVKHSNMGLFSFLKNAGSKVLTKKNAKAVKTEEIIKLEAKLLAKQKMILLQGVVESLPFDVENLNLKYSDDKVTIFGQVDSQEEREKVVLALGNVAGIAKVDDRLSVVKPAPEAQFYTVKKGDTLGKISKEVYGAAKHYKKIFEANKPMLKSANLIYPGQQLRIPALDNA